MSNKFVPEFHVFRFYEDGTETGATALELEDTNVVLNVSSGDVQFQIRAGIQEIGSGSIPGAATDDYQLQWRLNGGGSWSNITDASSRIQADTGSSLTDGNATTDRSTDGITDGGGSFVAGEQEAANGLIEDSQLTADNFTEHVWGLVAISAELFDGDFLDLRIISPQNTVTNSVVPRVTIELPISDIPIEPPAAQLELSTTAPALSQDYRRDPPAGNLQLSTAAALLSFGLFLTPAAANLEISTTAPTVDVTNNISITIPAANLQLSTVAPVLDVSVGLQTGVYFDGTNDWLDASTPSTGDTTEFSSVLWFKPDTGISSPATFIGSSNGRVRVRIESESGGKYRCDVLLRTSAPDTIADALTNYVFTPDIWHILFISYDSVTQTLHMWDATSDVSAGGGTLTTGTIDHTSQRSIGATTTGGGKFPGALQCIWIHDEFIDFSSSTERDKFLAGNVPNLTAIGADGSGPTGTQPLHWLRDPYDSFETNYGSAPDFTVNGALTDDGTLPELPPGPVSIKPPTAQLQLSTTAPIVDVTSGVEITVPAANLQLSTTAPVLLQNYNRVPPAAQLQVSTTAPTVEISDHVTITIPAANVEISTTAPVLSQGLRRVPPAANLALSTTASTINFGFSIAVPAAQLALSTAVPVLEVTANVLLAIPAGQLELSTSAPIVTTPVGIEIPAANLQLSTTAPNINFGFAIAIPAANLQSSTTAPVLEATANVSLTIPAGQLELSTTAPVLSVPVGIEIPTAQLALSTTAPSLVQDVRRSPPAAQLEVSTFAPVLTQDYKRQPDAANLQLSTTAPVVLITGVNVSIEIPSAQLELSTSVPDVVNSGEVASTAKHTQPMLVGLKHMMGM